jgi:hypothetical protein
MWGLPWVHEETLGSSQAIALFVISLAETFHTESSSDHWKIKREETFEFQWFTDMN